MTVNTDITVSTQPAPGLDRVLAAAEIVDVVLAPDGSAAALVTRQPDPATGRHRSAIHIVSTADGNRRPLVEGEQPAWSPDQQAIAFIAETSGSRQIWTVPADGGEPQQLSDHAGHIDRFRWSPDSRRIAFLSRPTQAADLKKLATAAVASDPIVVDSNNLPRNRLFVVDLASQTEAAITDDTYSVCGYEQWFPDTFSWSPDSRRIAFSRRPHAKAGGHLQGNIAVVSAEGGSPRLLTEREGMDGHPVWSPEGEQIAFLSTERDDWVTVSYLHTVDVESGRLRKITPDFDEKIKEFFWAGAGADDARQILFIAGDGVAMQVYSVDAEAAEVRPLTEGTDVISHLAVAADGLSLAFVRQSSDEPPALFFTTLEDFQPRRLVDADPCRNDWPTIETEIVRWKSFDGMEIEGLVHVPPGCEAGHRYPLLVIPHGGPHAVMSNTFVDGEVRLFAQQGWVVFRPNFRGSGHYGEAFLRANLRDWGHGDYQDVMSGVDHLIERGLVDPDRLAISGSSYGGYMTSWAISQTDRFRAAIAGAAVTDLPSFVRTTDVPERFECYLGRDASDYLRSSPMHFAENITTPTLVWHGDADIRVPLSQGRHLYTALLKNNVPAEFVIYPGEPHGIANAANQRDLLERKLRWLTSWVLEP